MPETTKIIISVFISILLVACGGGSNSSGGSSNGSSSSGGSSSGGNMENLSNNATLQSLLPDEFVFDQAFQSEQYDYTSEVFYLTSRVRLTPTSEDSSIAQMTINGEDLASGETSEWIELSEGENIINIDVTAEDAETVQRYQLALTRLGVDASIDSITAADQIAGDEFGLNFSVAGDTLAVGARFRDGTVANSGAVFVYRKIDGLWQREIIIEAADADAGDQFGAKVSLSGDKLAISAPRHDGFANVNTDRGAVYIYAREESGWEHERTLITNSYADNDRTGNGLSYSEGIVAIGAERDDSDSGDSDSGSVYLFGIDNNGLWQQLAKLVAPDEETNAFFGSEVSLNGGTLAIAADRDDSSAVLVDAGAVYIYTRNTDGDWLFKQKLVSSQQLIGGRFGGSIDLSDDMLAVGAEDFGEGSVQVFQLILDDWVEQVRLTEPDTGEFDLFGESVSLNGNLLAVSAREDNDVVENAGAVYLFELDNDTWTQKDKIVRQNSIASDIYGLQVHLTETELVASSLNTSSEVGFIYILQ